MGRPRLTTRRGQGPRALLGAGGRRQEAGWGQVANLADQSICNAFWAGRVTAAVTGAVHGRTREPASALGPREGLRQPGDRPNCPEKARRFREPLRARDRNQAAPGSQSAGDSQAPGARAGDVPAPLLLLRHPPPLPPHKLLPRTPPPRPHHLSGPYLHSLRPQQDGPVHSSKGTSASPARSPEGQGRGDSTSHPLTS